MRDPVLLTLALALVVVVFVGVLQVILDARRRRDLTPAEVFLHVETTGFSPAVCDQLGRRLRGVTAMRYEAKVGAVDRLYLEVLAHDGKGYLCKGSRVLPTPSRPRRP